MGFVERTDQKFNTLANKAVLTEADNDFIEKMAVLLDRQAQMGIDYLKPKKNSPQEMLINRLGVWSQLVEKYQQQLTFRRPPPASTPSV